MGKKQPQVILTRTPLSTLRYRLTTRTGKVLTAAVLIGAVVGAGVWQGPNVVRQAQVWVASISDRDALLAAQSHLSDRLAEAKETLGAAKTPIVSTNRLQTAVAECTDVLGGTVPTMNDCSALLVYERGMFQRDLDRYATASHTASYLKKAADAKAAADEAAAKAAAAAAAKAAADAAAAQAAAQAAAEEAARNAQGGGASEPVDTGGSNSGGGDSGGNGGGGGGGGASLSDSVTCSGPATVTATASGGGTVSVSISGPGSGSNSGGGSTSVTVSGGPGTYSISASSSGGGLSLSPSWAGACG